MPLVGNLKDFSLSDFLYLVDRGYKTGCLHLEHAGDTASLYFDKGKLIAAIKRNTVVQLGELLLKQNKISQQQLIAAQRATNGIPLAQTLIAQNVISRDDLQKTVQLYLEEEVIYGLFGWPEGEFRFEQNQRPSPDAPILPAPVPVENFIMEGVRRIDEWGRIRDRIASTDMIVKFTDQPGERAKGVNLAPEEWRVFARINGRDTLAEIAQKTGLTEFDVCRIVYGFLTAGLADVVRKPKPLPQAAVAGRSAAVEPPRVKKGLVSRIIARIRGM